MTIDDLKRFFNVTTQTAVGEKLNLTKGTVSNWKKGIPIKEQAYIEIATNGKLKADRTQVKML